MLLPPDYGEGRLIEFLRRRIPRDDLNTVKFGMACAKEILKDKLRYSGEPEYAFAMEVCERLVYSFGVTDSTMLLLALVRNIWRAEGGEEGSVGTTTELGGYQSEIVLALRDRLRQTCDTVLQQFRGRLPLLAVTPPGPSDITGSHTQQESTEWLGDWLKQLPTWFWTMQRNFRRYFRAPAENRRKQVVDRLLLMAQELRAHKAEGGWQESLEERLERAFVMEGAILLATLSELPFEPGRSRRKSLYNDHFSLFREIRRHLPNGPAKRRVVEKVERAFREVGLTLDLSHEAEWWDD